jgi:ribosomal protein L16 Arg81 hydroxylase
MQGVHRTWPDLVEFCQQLAEDLGHPVQANAYLTPPQSTGFSDHYDVHDVFVLQVEGEKAWRIRPPVHPLPLRDEPWTDHRAAVEEAAHRPPLIEATLTPGDCLYLPRGFLHSATALGATSTHLTIGVHAWTRRHVADELVAEALHRASSDERLRASLRLGADPSDADAIAADVELARAALTRALAGIDAADLTDALARRARAAQRAAPIGPIAQANAAANLQPDDLLEPRKHLLPHWSDDEGGQSVVTTRAGELRLETADAAAVRSFLAGDPARVADLGADLARRLVLAGVAVVVG